MAGTIFDLWSFNGHQYCFVKANTNTFVESTIHSVFSVNSNFAIESKHALNDGTLANMIWI